MTGKAILVFHRSPACVAAADRNLYQKDLEEADWLAGLAATERCFRANTQRLITGGFWAAETGADLILLEGWRVQRVDPPTGSDRPVVHRYGSHWARAWCRVLMRRGVIPVVPVYAEPHSRCTREEIRGFQEVLRKRQREAVGGVAGGSCPSAWRAGLYWRSAGLNGAVRSAASAPPHDCTEAAQAAWLACAPRSAERLRDGAFEMLNTAAHVAGRLRDGGRDSGDSEMRWAHRVRPEGAARVTESTEPPAGHQDGEQRG